MMRFPSMLAEGLPSPTKDEFWPVLLSLAALAWMVKLGFDIALKRRQLAGGHRIEQPVQVEGSFQTRPAISHASEDDVAALANDVREIKQDMEEMKLASLQRVADIREAFRAESAALSKDMLRQMKEEFRDAYLRINQHGEQIAAHATQLDILARGWRS